MKLLDYNIKLEENRWFVNAAMQKQNKIIVQFVGKQLNLKELMNNILHMKLDKFKISSLGFYLLLENYYWDLEKMLETFCQRTGVDW